MRNNKQENIGAGPRYFSYEMELISMHDIELRKIGDVHLSKNNLFNFGVEEYCSHFDVHQISAAAKMIIAVVLDYDDDVDSIYHFIDLANCADIMIFDITNAKGMQIMHLRRYMNEKYTKFKEISSIYELRLVYASINNSFRHI